MPGTGRRRWLRRVVHLYVLLACAVPSVAQTTGATTPHQHDAPGAATDLFPIREASGTAWQPDVAWMHGVHARLGAWDVMLHGNLFAQHIYEPGDRHRTGGPSNQQFSSVNWVMGMARRPIGAARVGVRAMLSLEPWTVSDCGYLNFLATGEVCEGDTIHDRQHPHDLFMELAADYDRPLRGSWRWQVYGGLSGEPALGPGAFPHRGSAIPNPAAPVSHHWLDATHITFGLITTGVYSQQWKAEMSIFNGREPDPQRADIDLGPLDSMSGRLTFMPTPQLAIQLSAGHLEESEAGLGLQPRSDVNRVTASAAYHRRIRTTGLWSSTVAYGMNSGQEITAGGVFDGQTHAVLIESAAETERHTWFGRAEIVGKPAHDLHAHEFGTAIFTVGKFQLGYVRLFPAWKGVMPGAGAHLTATVVPRDLAPRYAGRVAPGVGVFITLRPPRHLM